MDMLVNGVAEPTFYDFRQGQLQQYPNENKQC